MKLFYSFIKELKLASRGYYFYIELFVAFLILFVFLFAVPATFDSKSSEYIYLDMPKEAKDMYLEEILYKDIDKKAEVVKVKIDNEKKDALLYITEDKKIYVLNNKEDVIDIADKERKTSGIIKIDDENNVKYEYYLQGYESQRLKNLLKILHVEEADTLKEVMDNQDVRSISTNYELLSDRENILPSVLVFNGSLMGLFIIAAYIFLDKKEGVIKAYAITPSPVWQYLMSKVGVTSFTSIISSLIVLIPIMGFKPDYILLLVLLIVTGFFSSSLGLLIASFYKNIMQAFGVLYVVMMLMILPNIAYFIPSWDPSWIKIIPTYFMLEGFKTILIGNNDFIYILSVSGGFLITGIILFVISNERYKRNLLE
ncbi:ABC transporter permease [Defluviitalea phaphyphila]|uniref:ABC transporter permease n=1 Tax=Defluviitalea phaphyphila TaxID=1473580 RepID=UPI00072FB9CD|nr:ABC transporter permease [Defluviitalea phaphyphila]